MSVDDDADCVEHVWQLTGIALLRRGAGAQTEYVCVRPTCEAVMLVGPDDIPPGTV